MININPYNILFFNNLRNLNFLALKRLFETAYGPRPMQETGRFGQIFK